MHPECILTSYYLERIVANLLALTTHPFFVKTPLDVEQPFLINTDVINTRYGHKWEWFSTLLPLRTRCPCYIKKKNHRSPLTFYTYVLLFTVLPSDRYVVEKPAWEEDGCVTRSNRERRNKKETLCHLFQLRTCVLWCLSQRRGELPVLRESQSSHQETCPVLPTRYKVDPLCLHLCPLSSLVLSQRQRMRTKVKMNHIFWKRALVAAGRNVKKR